MEKILLAIDHKIATITFNRPQVHNAFDIDSYKLLTKHLHSMAQHTDIHAVILTGGSAVFSAGNDINDFVHQLNNNDLYQGLDFLLALRQVPIPVIAAVEGHAIGIGTTLLLHCDFVFAAENAVFTMPFVPLGLSPEGGSSELLSQVVGLRKAQEWLYLGSKISAQQAKESGFIHDITPNGESIKTAQKVALQLSQMPRTSLLATKALLQAHQHFDIKTCFEREKQYFTQCLHSPETQTIMKNFLNKI
ncbi:enoyl-CoA hydratase [Pelistega sp. NLN82]|uniref:Enoyl-CoA hydratase n=1 Tax=Pelistega ratti TaxID=2652177 RepID=A0A6L9Y431_9BURK|nr:enoyl-CoA hydratase-related protein [Pelistega ratti]NEN74925.1 enoyl-CoA hydratase [Pelistega ratti]